VANPAKFERSFRRAADAVNGLRFHAPVKKLNIRSGTNHPAPESGIGSRSLRLAAGPQIRIDCRGGRVCPAHHSPTQLNSIFANPFTSALIKMKIAAIVLLLLAVACEVFAYWGINTVAGRRAFDEMAGIIPFAAGVFGGLLAACAVLAWWYAR
jgi:hypothetical protein